MPRTIAIAKRLEAVLPLVINSDHTGVRLISDIVRYCAAKKPLGLAVFLDFEKAFDSMNGINNFLFRLLTSLILALTSKIGHKLLFAT